MIKIQNNIFKFLVILCGLIAIDGKTDQDLCNLCPPGQSSEHIFCMFPNPGPADKSGCRQVDISITNDEFRQKVLNWHNNYRNKFAEGSWKSKYDDNGKEVEYRQDPKFPRAANMRLLMYDYQLEKLAMRNAQNCYQNHEQCRAVERFTYGQNLGFHSWSVKSGLDKDTESTWEAWVGEMRDYKSPDILEVGKVEHGNVVNHFIATTWANTRLLGCAQVYYVDDNDFHRMEVVCNYGPMGVWVGEDMYLAGTPGSKCPEGTKAGYNSTYPNLCGGVNASDTPYMDPASAKCIHLKCDLGTVLFLLGCVEIWKLFF